MTVEHILKMLPPYTSRAIKAWTEHMTPSELAEFNRVIEEAWNKETAMRIGDQMIAVTMAVRKFNASHADHLAVVTNDVKLLAETLRLWLDTDEIMINTANHIRDVMAENRVG